MDSGLEEVRQRRLVLSLSLFKTMERELLKFGHLNISFLGTDYFINDPFEYNSFYSIRGSKAAGGIYALQSRSFLDLALWCGSKL